MFSTELACKSILSILQVIASLAVAENLYQFEHRDLHHGNILIKHSSSKNVKIIIADREYRIESQNLSVCIIDFTMSRLQSGTKCYILF